MSVVPADVVAYQGVLSAKALTLLVLTSVAALVAFYAFVAVHRVSDDYSTAGWMVCMPVPMVCGGLLLCAVSWIGMCSRERGFGHFATFCGVLLVMGSWLWSVLSDPVEFDGVKAASIAGPDSVFGSSEAEALLIAALVTAGSMAYIYYLLGYMRLDLLPLVSPRMFFAFCFLALLAYASTAVSTMFVRISKGKLEAYAGSLLVCLAVALFLVVAMEQTAFRAVDHYADHYVDSYNRASAQTHDAVRTTSETLRWAILLALALPSAMVWTMRDNIQPEEGEDAGQTLLNAGKAFGVLAAALPFAATMIVAGAHNMQAFRPIATLVDSGVLCDLAFIFILSATKWTEEKIVPGLCVAAFLVLATGMGPSTPAHAALRMAFTLAVARLIARQYAGRDIAPFNTETVAAAIVVAVAVGDAVVRTRNGQPVDQPVLLATYAFGTIAARDGTGALEREPLLFATDFAFLNIALTANHVRPERGESALSEGLAPFALGLIAAVMTGEVEADPRLIQWTNEMQELAASRDADLIEDLAHL